MTKNTLIMVIMLQLIAHSPCRAQISIPEHAFEAPATEDPLDQMKNRSECREKQRMLRMNPGDKASITELTQELLQSNLAGENEVKNIYRANGCNPEITAEPNQSHHSWIQNKKTEDEGTENSCEFEDTLSDIEGCAPIRKLYQAIKDGQFTPEDYRSIRGKKKFQYSNISTVVSVVAVAISAVSTYLNYEQKEIARKSLELEKQKYEASQKQNSQPAPEPKAPEQKVEPKESHESPTTPPQKNPEPNKTPNEYDFTPEPEAIQSLVIEDPKHPVVENDPNQDSLWDNFKTEIEGKKQKCDQVKEAKEKGITVSEMNLRPWIHANQNRESFSRCNVAALRLSLQLIKSRKTQCNDLKCITEKKERDQKKRTEQKRKQEMLQRCQMTMGGSSDTERLNCNELQKEALGNFPEWNLPMKEPSNPFPKVKIP